MSTVIKVENLSKQYRLGVIGTGTLSHDLNRWWNRVRGKEDPVLKIGSSIASPTNDNEYVWALKDLSFEIQKGEVVGVIGRNGAGKSTLLKILSRTTLPTSGTIKVKGRIASLLEVGTGFHPELTGRENTFLNGAILGMRKHEIEARFDEIIEFAGVGKYVDTPVKRYSSGMYVRLAFAVAAHLEPDILIVDEVLAVGDAEFQRKALGKMKDVSAEDGRTVLFVSHNMAAVRTLCTSGILLEQGRISAAGSTEAVLNKYLNREVLGRNRFVNNPSATTVMALTSISILDGLGQLSDSYFHNSPFFVELEFKIRQENPGIYFGIHVMDSELQTLLFTRSLDFVKGDFKAPGNYRTRIKFPAVLVPGNYSVSVHIAYISPPTLIEGFDHICSFDVVPAVMHNRSVEFVHRGKFLIEPEWSVNISHD